MAITYTWKITNLKTTTVGNTSGIVVQASWSKTGINENGIIVKYNGFTIFNIPDTSLDTFIPLPSLKESDLLLLVQQQIPELENNTIDPFIQKQIDGQANLIVNSALPWATN